jgi:hypothetical protein
MAKGELYTVRTNPNSVGRFFCIKYDEKMLIETGQYELHRAPGIYSCQCWAKFKATCRHREIVETFIDASAVDTWKLYSFDKKRWDSREAPHFDEGTEND